MIKSAVDDLKKSGAPMSLTLPPGGGGSPSSPSPYVCVCLCVCLLICSKSKIYSLLAKVHPSQNISFLLSFSLCQADRPFEPD